MRGASGAVGRRVEGEVDVEGEFCVEGEGGGLWRGGDGALAAEGVPFWVCGGLVMVRGRRGGVVLR